MRKNSIIMGMTLFFTLTLLSLSFAEESITITTYYPSPYGSYKQLSVAELGAQTAADYGLYLTNIATSSTASINKYGMYISSTGTWDGASANNYGLYIDTPTGGTNNYGLIVAGGNVGIGTTAPGNLLSVYGATPVVDIETSDAAIIDGDDLGTIQFRGLDATLTHLVGAMIRAEAVDTWDGDDVDNAPTELQFFTEDNTTTDNLATPRMVITMNGNVGIGTTNPGALLDLGTAGTKAGVIRLAGSTSGNVTVKVAAAAGTWSMTLPINDGSSGYQLTTNGSGVTSWTSASSLREMKDIIGTVQPDDALNKILGTPVYRFHYKPGMGTGDSDTEYVGVMADEAPWAMHFGGTIVNPVNTLGYMVLGIQALNERIVKLTSALNVVNGNVGIGMASPTTKLAVVGLTGSASGSYLRYLTDGTGRIYYDSSSIKYKENVKLLKDNFNRILKVQPRSFIDRATGNREIGYIAEELDKLGLNNLVAYKNNEPDSIKYERLVLYLIEVVKNQQKRIDKIETQLNVRR